MPPRRAARARPGREDAADPGPGPRGAGGDRGAAQLLPLEGRPGLRPAACARARRWACAGGSPILPRASCASGGSCSACSGGTGAPTRPRARISGTGGRARASARRSGHPAGATCASPLTRRGCARRAAPGTPPSAHSAAADCPARPGAGGVPARPASGAGGGAPRGRGSLGGPQPRVVLAEWPADRPAGRLAGVGGHPETGRAASSRRARHAALSGHVHARRGRGPGGRPGDARALRHPGHPRLQPRLVTARRGRRSAHRPSAFRPYCYENCYGAVAINTVHVSVSAGQTGSRLSESNR